LYSDPPTRLSHSCSSVSKCISYPMLRAISIAAICVVAVAINGQSNSRSIGLNVYGLSHHFLKKDQSRKYLSEVNPGAGLRGTRSSGSGNWTTIEMGMYRDSFRRLAKYVAAGYHLRTWRDVRIGFWFGLYSSRSIKNDETIPILIPAFSYHASFCTLNIVYLPRFRNVNPYSTLGTYLTIPLATKK
jgi:Antimicrobial peptide resistance and lipid A acylation protein PagP